MRLVLFACALAACSSLSRSSPFDGALGGSDGSSAGGGDGAISPGPPFGMSESGIATFYDATGEGACSFDATPNDLDVAAMDMPEWNNSAPCGECVRVTSPNGQVTVRIVDLCPGCEVGHLDLSMEAFAKIAPVSAGRVSITGQPVACGVSGPVAYRYKEGSSQYWTAIQVRNSRLPITKLEVQLGGSWQEVPRASYNYFVRHSGVGTTAGFPVRITAVDGQRLTDSLPPVAAGMVVDGAGQFQ
jgi:expansin (peptidoglycan-binding protein)